MAAGVLLVGCGTGYNFRGGVLHLSSDNPEGVMDKDTSYYWALYENRKGENQPAIDPGDLW